MSYMIVRHKVREFSTWKTVFDEHGSTRASAGCKGGRLFRFSEDPNHLLMVFEWDNHENARTFAQSEDLRNTIPLPAVQKKGSRETRLPGAPAGACSTPTRSLRGSNRLCRCGPARP